MATIFDQRQLMRQVDDITNTEQMITGAFSSVSAGIETLRGIRATWGAAGTVKDGVSDSDRELVDAKIALYQNKINAANAVME